MRHNASLSQINFSVRCNSLSPVNTGCHIDCQNFVIENLRMYYPNYNVSIHPT